MVSMVREKVAENYFMQDLGTVPKKHNCSKGNLDYLPQSSGKSNGCS